MKKISLFLFICSFSFSTGFCLDAEITDLEKELLSLEHEFLDSLEEISENTSLEIERISLQDPFPSSLLEGEESTLAAEEKEQALATLPDQEPIPAYPHEEFQPSLEKDEIAISLKQVFSNSPFIYSLLLGMSFTSIAICLYIILRVREQTSTSEKLYEKVRTQFLTQDFHEASKLCVQDKNWLGKILLSGIQSKKYGMNAVLDNMKSEGKRATISAWQQLGILQDIAIISPMLGLLGTVIGLFYAFYDLNRSFNSISHLLDGLGISVGTTVAGICVAILSMVLHSLTKFRLLRSLAKIETEASTLAYLIESQPES